MTNKNKIQEQATLLHLLRYNRALDKTSASKFMDVSWPTASKIFDELTDDGVLIPVPINPENPNINNSYMNVNPKYGTMLGISLGSAQSKIIFQHFDFQLFSTGQFAPIKEYLGSSIKDILMEDPCLDECLQNKNRNYIYFRTPSSKDTLKKVLNTIFSCVKNIYEQHLFGIQNIISIGISSTGIVDSNRQIILEAHNLEALNNTPLEDLIYEDKMQFFEENDIQIYLTQNSTAAIIAEKYELYNTNSKHKDKKNIVALYLGAGVGAGIILNGKLYEGISGLAGEIGHISVPLQDISPDVLHNLIKEGKEAPKCSCGNIYCYDNRIRLDVFEMNMNTFSQLRTNEIADYLSLDENCAKKEIFGGYIGSIVNLLSNLLNIELIIFTGKFSRSMDLLWSSIHSSRDKNPLKFNRNDCAMIQSNLAALSPAIGASIAAYHNKYHIEIEWK